MWSDRKPWWAKKAEDNKVDKTHYKNWCVIEMYSLSVVHSGQGLTLATVYRACAKLNAPKIYDDGIMQTTIVVDNLTKHEAHEVAKGLNFLDGGEK